MEYTHEAQRMDWQTRIQLIYGLYNVRMKGREREKKEERENERER